MLRMAQVSGRDDRVVLSGSCQRSWLRTTAPFQQPDDEPNQSREEKDWRCDNQPDPAAALEGGHIAAHDGAGLTTKSAAHRRQVASDFGCAVKANVTNDGCHIAADGSIAFHHNVAANCGDIPRYLAENVDRTADTGKLTGLLIGTDADVVAELGVFGIAIGGGKRNG